MRVLRRRTTSLLLRPGSIEVVCWRVPLLLLLVRRRFFLLLDLWRRLGMIDCVLSSISELYDVVQEVVVFVVDLKGRSQEKVSSSSSKEREQKKDSHRPSDEHSDPNEHL